MTSAELEQLIKDNVSIINKLNKQNTWLYVKLQEQLNIEMEQMTIEDYLKE
jgi:hypothetical protein